MKHALALFAFLVAGCAETRSTPLAANHPANPDAAVAPAAAPSDTLVITPGPAKSPATSPSATAAYVCPMHPDVTSDVPGRCPRCGMALVKKASQ